MIFEEEQEKGKVQINPFLWLIPIMLTGIGVLMITSTTSTSSFAYTGTPFQMGLKQLQWLLIAIVTALFIYMIPLKFYYKWSGPFLILSWILAWMPLVPGVGTVIGGARRWIHVPGVPVNIQPGEILCLAMAIHLSKLLTRENRTPLRMFLVTMVLVVVGVLPLLAQPDFGTTCLMFIVSMGMFIEKKGWKYPLLIGSALILPVACLLVSGESYRMRRISAFLNPWEDPLNTGYQAIQGLIAFANGGLWGTGLGHGFQKLNYLPAVHTDFIFASIGEELGLIGTAFVLCLFFFWFVQCNIIYARTNNAFQSSLVWGIALTVLLPLSINVLGVTKFIPLTGMPLPFVSYGGTSLVLMWAKVAILMRTEKEIFLGITDIGSETE